jgi:hypothetical protein
LAEDLVSSNNKAVSLYVINPYINNYKNPVFLLLFLIFITIAPAAKSGIAINNIKFYLSNLILVKDTLLQNNFQIMGLPT